MSICKLTELLNESNNVVFFGGAGTSTESGIPDFRSSSGLYKNEALYNYPPEVMLSHDFFVNHTEEFYRFYREKMIYKDAKPNTTHIVLEKLERIGKLKAVITQNIDGLHQMAGSANVLELHGSIHRNFCTRCGKSYNLNDILCQSKVPICDVCGGIVKPDVVLYGEQLDNQIVSQSVKYIAEADMLIIGGTSLAVYPAANLINYFSGNNIALINKSSTPSDWKANIVIHDSIGKVLIEVIKRLDA